MIPQNFLIVFSLQFLKSTQQSLFLKKLYTKYNQFLSKNCKKAQKTSSKSEVEFQWRRGQASYKNMDTIVWNQWNHIPGYTDIRYTRIITLGDIRNRKWKVCKRKQSLSLFTVFVIGCLATKLPNFIERTTIF